MSKKQNFKLENLRDKKFIFPLLILVIVLIIGWFIFGIISEVKGDSNNDQTQSEGVEEIQSIPAGEGGEISSKSDAMNESYKEMEDYTALSNLYDPTLIASDTTVYTAEEIAYLDSLERIANMNQADIDAMNEQIRKNNEELQSSRSLGNLEDYNTGTSSDNDKDNDLLNEMMLYQKLINGEEILTPEQESERREAQIRAEERQKVYDELNAKETNMVEKVDGSDRTIFNTVSTRKQQNSSSPNTFKAMVDQTTKVEQGSRLRLILLEDIKVSDKIVKAGTPIYGVVSGFSEQRIEVEVTSIIVNKERVKVELIALDVDGIKGLYVPKSEFRDASKAAASQALQGGQMNINSSPDNFIGMAAQAVQNAYQSVSQAVSSNITKNKATIKYNTILYLTNDK